MSMSMYRSKLVSTRTTWYTVLQMVITKLTSIFTFVTLIRVWNFYKFRRLRIKQRRKLVNRSARLPPLAMLTANVHLSYCARATTRGVRHGVPANTPVFPQRSLRARSSAWRQLIAVASLGAGGATGVTPAQTFGDVVPEKVRCITRIVSAAATGEATAASGVGNGDDVEKGDKKKLRVAYQGMPGAYSEAAALTAYPTCDPCPCEQFENAFEATEQWTADRAVLPFENSLGGSIHRNYDLILQHRLHVVGEVSTSGFVSRYEMSLTGHPFIS